MAVLSICCALSSAVGELLDFVFIVGVHIQVAKGVFFSKKPCDIMEQIQC